MSDDIRWTEEALKTMEKVPGFVRPMARTMIENFAQEKGIKEITTEVMKEARAKFGM